MLAAQAKRTLSGFDTLTSVTTDFLGLHTSFAREQESFPGYNSRVRCQVEHLRKSVRLLANDAAAAPPGARRGAGVRGHGGRSGSARLSKNFRDEGFAGK